MIFDVRFGSGDHQGSLNVPFGHLDSLASLLRCACLPRGDLGNRANGAGS